MHWWDTALWSVLGHTSKAALWLQPGAPTALGHPSGQLGWYVYAFIALGALLLAFVAYKVWLHWQGHAAELTPLDKATAAMLRALRPRPNAKTVNDEVFGSLKIAARTGTFFTFILTISSLSDKDFNHQQYVSQG